MEKIYEYLESQNVDVLRITEDHDEPVDDVELLLSDEEVEDVEKIDLSVRPGLPSFIDVLEEVLKELEVQKMYIAEEIKTENPKQLEAIKRTVPNVEIEFIPHSELKKDLKSSKAFIRTGEETPYSNVILESGVVF